MASRTIIVAWNKQRFPKRNHEEPVFQRLVRHDARARSIRQAFRLGRVAITTQIGTDNGEVLRELRGDARPHGFVLRKAVQ